MKIVILQMFVVNHQVRVLLLSEGSSGMTTRYLTWVCF